MFDGATAFLASYQDYGGVKTPGQLFWTLFSGVITDDNGVEYRQPNHSTNLTIGNDKSKLIGLIAFYNASANAANIIKNYIGEPNTWDVSQITNMDGLFFGSTFNQPINDWDTRNVTSMNQMFYDSSFNQDISKWDISNVTDMEEMFYKNYVFNQDILSLIHI